MSYCISNLALVDIDANWGFLPQISPSRGDRDPCLIQYYFRTKVTAKWHLIPTSGFSAVHECQQTTDERTRVFLNETSFVKKLVPCALFSPVLLP